MSIVLEALSKSNSLLAKAHAIAQEKDSLESHKLKSSSTTHILEFLSNFKTDSVQSAVKFVPPLLRPGLAFEIGLKVSLEEAYGKDVGPNQPFLKALHFLVRAREDMDYNDILSGLAMAKTTTFNRENIIAMMAAVSNEIKITQPSLSNEIKITYINHIYLYIITLVFIDRTISAFTWK